MRAAEPLERTEGSVARGGARRPPASRPALLGGLLLALLAWPGSGPGEARAQDAEDLRREILASEERLEEIREERRRLQDELEDLDADVRNAAAELRNVERRLSASRSALAEIRLQVEAKEEEVEEASRELERTRQRLEERTEALLTRLREIYKRGPLHAVEVLLAADSFADLLHRYRYLQLLSHHDRGLVEEVAALERELEAREERRRSELEDLERLREAQQGEVAELEALQEERRRNVERYRQERARTERRMEEMDEALRLDDLDELLRELHRARTEGRGGGAPAGGGGFSGADLGRLPWPVEGEAIPADAGGEVETEGVAVRAPFGEPVRAVRRGHVVLAGPMEGWGRVVILEHGGGHYSAYLHLDDVGVVQGRTAEAGQVVGTVGGWDTDLGPHLRFHLWGEGLEPADPLAWLRPPDDGPEAARP